MPAVTLAPGKYFVGNPVGFFPDWKPNANGSPAYKVDHYTYFAFTFAGAGWVCAIPFDAIQAPGKKTKMSMMTFTKPEPFFEFNGIGSIAGVQLHYIGATPVEDVAE